MEKKKIKVLQAIRQGKVGGGESHILSLVEHIDATKFEPFVLSFTDGEMITELNNTGVQNFVIPSEKPFDFTTWNKVKKLMQKEQIDIVHIHGTRASSNIYWAAKNLRLPVVYTIHGWSFHDDQSALVKNMRITFEKWITRQTNCNISVSASNQKTGKDKIAGFTSSVIYNGIDVEKFNPDNAERKCVRHELNIPSDAFVISFIGRVTAQKDPLGLLNAFQKVIKVHNNAILLIVGDGDLKEEVMQHTKSLGIAKSVVFQNFRSDVADILFSSDIYCLPSLWEGFPIGLLEAMAMRKPVIATNVDGSCEIIKHEINGMLIAPQNEEILSDTIIELMNNKTLINNLGKAARLTITENFDVCKMTRQIENIYTNILSNN